MTHYIFPLKLSGSSRDVIQNGL